MLGPFIVPNENDMHKKRRGRGVQLTVTGGHRGPEVARNVGGKDGKWRYDSDHRKGRRGNRPEHPGRHVSAPPAVVRIPTGARVAHLFVGALYTPEPLTCRVPPPAKSASALAPPGDPQNPGSR